MAAFDITDDTVEAAVVTTGTDPATDDWFTAAWVRSTPGGKVTTLSTLSTEYRYVQVTGTVDGSTDTAWVQMLIGPGTGADINLTTAGKYDVWVRVTDSPEVPAILAGTITLT